MWIMHCFSGMLYMPCIRLQGQGGVPPERNDPAMNHRTKAAGFAALLCCMLMTGCGDGRHTTQAEHSRAAVTERTAETDRAETDRDNALYEEDDVHRKTDRDEPDIIDRADSAMDSVEKAVTDLVSDAERELDEMR